MQPGKLIRVSGLYVILLPRTLIRKTCSAGGGSFYESTTTRKAGGLDFTAIGGKRQGREVPQSLRVEPGAKHPVWKTQSSRVNMV
jgi:hypothetical protein